MFPSSTGLISMGWLGEASPSIAPSRPEDKCTTGDLENLSQYI
jgi:hypothetical protein